MMDVEEGYYYGLKGVGKEIWATIQDPISVREVCDLMLRRYAASEEVVHKEVLDFLTDLHSRGLIHVEDGSQTA